MRITLNRIRVLGLTALIAASVSACNQQALAQQEDILRPEQAFPYTLTATGDEILVQFDIPDGYYLYRQRFDFDSETQGISLGEPLYPEGEIHEDEFFGVVETYRHQLDIPIPYGRVGNTESLDLDLVLQGCADIGLCYPPQHWSRSVDLPAAAATPRGTALTNLMSGASARDDGLLPADEAFVMNARVEGANELVVGWTIAPDHYMYRDKFEFSVNGPIGLGTAELPAGEPHDDLEFGNVEVYFGYVEATIPFTRATPEAVDVELIAGGQGCKVDSICLPPETYSMALTIPSSSEFDFVAPTSQPMVSEQDRLASLIVSGSWWAVAATFYGLGLLLAFTPCVLPMVPILSGMIAGGGRETTAMRGFTLSLAYVMGMALTYTAGGAVAAMAGAQVQAMFQQPWILTIFAGLFVLLALAMFGAFEMQMPSAIQTRLSALASRQSAGSYAGVAVMGALSALIVTTCVAPPLIATLAVIGQTGDVARGSGALFALSLGMGSPLLVVGASAGKLLPKAGPWMNSVKAAFGVMMIAVAIWMMDRVLPGTVTLLLWALLVFLSGVFLGAFEPLPAVPSAPQRLRKGIGVLACIYGALMLIGVSLGGTNPIRPVPLGVLGGAMSQAAASPGLQFVDVETVAELEAAVADATAASRPVMVDLTADWCVSCKEMEHYTFPDPAVVDAYSPFVLLRVDVTENDDDDREILRYFETFGPPVYAFFDRSGQLRDEYELLGFLDAEAFSAHARRFAGL